MLWRFAHDNMAHTLDKYLIISSVSLQMTEYKT